MPSQAQHTFNKTYITAGEIARECAVSRPSVHNARNRGVLPDPVLVGDNLTYIWEREAARPHIDAWKRSLKEGVQA